jgi:acetyltransferase-like isoleucine patch superfamily enzyme
VSRDGRSRIPAPLRSIAGAVLNRLATGKNVSIGSGFRAGSGSRINSLHGLRVGENFSLGPGSLVEVDGEIGDYVLIARGVQVVGRLDHAIDAVGVPIVESEWIGDREKSELDAVKIGNDVWLGAGVVVLGGTRIGEGAIVGGGAVVASDVPPYAIAVGNPARVVGYRFDSDSDREKHSAALRARSKT